MKIVKLVAENVKRLHAVEIEPHTALVTVGGKNGAGKSSVLFDAPTVDAALAWTAGSRSVPLAVQHQPYTRRDDLLTPDLLRVYQRGTTDAGIVTIRK